MTVAKGVLQALCTLCGFFAPISAACAQAEEANWFSVLPAQTVGADGVFDPSLITGEDGDLFLSFSAVNPNAKQPAPHDRKVSTYLASSTDKGETWKILESPVNPSIDLETSRGTASWQHEVSTLSYDHTDEGLPVWRLISHHYPLIKGKREFQYGWIALKTADTFGGLVDAPETKLFVGKAYKAHAQQPVTDGAVLELHKLHKDLARCAVFTEPGLLATNNTVYLALNCVEVRPFWKIHHKVVLLACDQPCDAARPSAWRYISSLLVESDTRHRQHKYYSAPDIYENAGKYFMVASPVGDQPFKDAYNGCDIFQFEDLATGRLVQEMGMAKRISHIEGIAGSFNGACAITESPDLTMLSQLRIINGRAYFDILRNNANP